MRSFLLIPNHSMADHGDFVRIESAEAALLEQIRPHFSGIGIAAFVMREGNSSLNGTVKRSDTTTYRLNLVEHDRSRISKLINYLTAAITLPAALWRHDFLYIFCPGYCGLLAGIYARLSGKPYALYVRGFWGYNAITARLWRWVFRRARFMIVTGESFRRHLSQYCQQVVNEVPLTAFRPSDIDPAPSHSRVSKRFLFTGQLVESKGVLDVIRAVAQLRDEGQQVELAIAGGGMDHHVQAIRDTLDQLSASHYVTLLGHLPPRQMADEFLKSGVFVFPSYYPEGFPRVLYEAMMNSMPIVTCEMPGTKGFLNNEENCLYCRPKDPAHLATALSRLLDEPALAKKLGARARRDVQELYDSFIDDSHAHQLLRHLDIPSNPQQQQDSGIETAL